MTPGPADVSGGGCRSHRPARGRKGVRRPAGLGVRSQCSGLLGPRRPVVVPDEGLGPHFGTLVGPGGPQTTRAIGGEGIEVHVGERAGAVSPGGAVPMCSGRGRGIPVQGERRGGAPAASQAVVQSVKVPAEVPARPVDGLTDRAGETVPVNDVPTVQHAQLPRRSVGLSPTVYRSTAAVLTAALRRGRSSLRTQLWCRRWLCPVGPAVSALRMLTVRGTGS